LQKLGFMHRMITHLDKITLCENDKVFLMKRRNITDLEKSNVLQYLQKFLHKTDFDVFSEKAKSTDFIMSRSICGQNCIKNFEFFMSFFKGGTRTRCKQLSFAANLKPKTIRTYACSVRSFARIIEEI